MIKQHRVESALGVAAPSTINTIIHKTKESTVTNPSRVILREQSLPSYLKKAVVTTATKSNEFGPVNITNPVFLHFEDREKKDGTGTYKFPRFDMEGILRLPTNKQVQVVTDELRLAMSVCGQRFACDLFTSQLEWALRKPGREALNFIAYKAFNGAEVSDDIRRLANLLEVSFEGQQALVDVVRTIGKCDMSIHAFHTHFKQSDMASGEDEDMTRAELSDEELSAEELMQVYAQKELRVKKESWSSVLGSDNAGSGIDPRISKEEWISELIQRCPEDWAEQASYGAWAKSKKVLELAITNEQFQIGREHMGQFKAKPLSFYLRARRRVWDLKASVVSTENRYEYIESRQVQADNGVNEMNESNAGSITTASMLNAKSDDELDELSMKLRDLKAAIEQLELICGLFEPLFKVASIDGELLSFKHYECYLMFDPVQEAVNQVRLMFERTGKRFSYEDKKQAVAMVKRELQGAEVEKLDGGMYHLFWDKPISSDETLERIRRVRVLRYKHDLRTGSFDKEDAEKLKKAYAMRNKKQFILDDAVDSFDT